MTATRKWTGVTACLLAALVVANAAQAQSGSAAKVPVAVPAQQVTPETIFTRWDKDMNKNLSLDEFKAGWQEVQTTAALRKLHGNFVAMDANKSGSLEAAEYANLELIKQSGSSAPLMSAFDADKNQSLDFKEYVGLVNIMMANKR